MTLLDRLSQILRDLDNINQLDPEALTAQLAEGFGGEVPLGYADNPADLQAGAMLSVIGQVTRDIAERAQVSHIQVVSRITSSDIQIGPPEDGAPAE